MVHEHGGGAEVATAAWLSDGEGKSERGRAREWECKRAAAAPPFTPSAGQTGRADAHGLAAVGHDALGRPIQIEHQAD